MKLIYILINLLFISFTIVAQNKVPRMVKYPVGNTGIQLYMPAVPTAAETSYSPDSAKITTIECMDSSQGKIHHFGAIVAQMHNMNLKGQEEEMGITYMDYLKSAFKITKSAGYGRGHTLNTNAAAKGIIDYWEDEDGNQWKITTWVVPDAIVVLFTYGKQEYPIYNIVDMYMKGIRFPGD